MADRSYLEWPFLEDSHRALAADIDAWAKARFGDEGFHDHADVDAHCRTILKDLAAAGWTSHAVPVNADRLDVRTDRKSVV